MLDRLAIGRYDELACVLNKENEEWVISPKM